MDTFRNVVEDTREKLEDLGEGARDAVTGAMTDVRRMVRKHPLESVLIALGVGVLLGAVLKRR